MTEKTISNNMIFFESIKESIDVLDLSDKLKVEYYEGIINYGLYGIMPTFSNPALMAVFIALKPNIDANNRRKQRALACSENGKKGGAPRGNANACKSNHSNTKTSKKTSPKTTIDIDSDIDRDSDVDVDVDRDEDKKKEINILSSYSSFKEKEQESNVVKGNSTKQHHQKSDNRNTRKGGSTGNSGKRKNTYDIEQRNVQFYKSLIPYLDTYGTDAIQKFYDYWTESDTSHQQMRFELEKTWDLDYRLERWMQQRRRLNL